MTASPTASKPKAVPWLFVVLLVTFAAIAPSVANDFTYDDRWVAMGEDGRHHNPMVAELQPLGVYFESHYWRGTTDHSRLYRPATILSFALRHAMVGDNPQVAHLINIALHLLATALVCLLLRGIRCSGPVAALGALFFGLHAVHSEVVATVVGRSELLAFCGGAGAVLLLSKDTTGGARIARWSAALACFSVAVFAKESALVWIPFAACFALARRWSLPGDTTPQTANIASIVISALALLTPAAAMLILRAHMLADLPPDVAWNADYTVNPIFGVDTTSRMLTAGMVWGFGLVVTCLPLWLAADWGAGVMPIVSGLSDPAALLTLVAALALGTLLVAGLWRAKRRPAAFLCATTFLGFSIATSNLLFPIGTIYGERLMYAPSLAISFAVAWIASRLRSQHVPLALGAAGVWIGLSTLMLFERCSVWRDNATLVHHEVHNQPNSVRMRVQSALLLAESGRTATAATHLEHAVRLDPGCVDAWGHLGDLRAEAGNTDAAIDCYRAALGGRQREVARFGPDIEKKLSKLQSAAAPR